MRVTRTRTIHLVRICLRSLFPIFSHFENLELKCYMNYSCDCGGFQEKRMSYANTSCTDNLYCSTGGCCESWESCRTKQKIQKEREYGISTFTWIFILSFVFGGGGGEEKRLTQMIKKRSVCLTLWHFWWFALRYSHMIVLTCTDRWVLRWRNSNNSSRRKRRGPNRMRNQGWMHRTSLAMGYRSSPSDLHIGIIK